MPLAMERALKREAKKKGFKGERADHFVYGIMSSRGWRRKKKKTLLTGKK